MADDGLPEAMRSAALALLAVLDDEQRALAAQPFEDDAARRWLEYRPRSRPGASIAQMSPVPRKAAHRLLATGLSEHAYAQAMSIIALEEVLDQREQWRRGRHSNDYWVNVFGDPAGDAPWSWRFEGHHLSVTMTVAGDRISPAPVFFGANPACVSYAGRPVSRPLAPEEDLAQGLLGAMEPAERDLAVVRGQAPGDIRTGTSPRAREGIEPLGVAAGQLGSGARAMLGELVTLYLDRLPAELAARETARLTGAELHFAWEGPVRSSARHYYRVQGDDLLIEYDTTADGNHAHTVLRRPRSDFGDDVLAEHYRRAHS
ncbi:MAG TPA: DUF3500 domain-containing protein [Streptosporangiaceae bacterium]|nr:DUF3500 domain-containing protein [Streptosporangiaceae bacterium]